MYVCTPFSISAPLVAVRRRVPAPTTGVLPSTLSTPSVLPMTTTLLRPQRIAAIGALNYDYSHPP